MRCRPRPLRAAGRSGTRSQSREEDIVGYLTGDPRRPAPAWMTSFQLSSLHTVRGLLLTCELLPEIDQL